MSDKLEFNRNAFSRVADVHVLRLEGRDAIAFAQAQFSSDVVSLPDGAWQWSAWLTPKGRVIALFGLLRVSAERLDLLLHDAQADGFAAQLQRFVFRSKVTITRPSGSTVGAFQTPDQAAGNRFAMDGNGIEIDFGSDGSPRTLRLSDALDAPAHESEFANAWRRADLLHGLPRLPEHQQSQWTPQQLSLDRLRAYSVKKGCYPGQEIVARTHFLGKAKRGLQCLQTDTVPVNDTDDEVMVDGVAIGKRVSSAGNVHLAVMPLDDTTPTSLSIQGIRTVTVPLSDGLAR